MSATVDCFASAGNESEEPESARGRGEVEDAGCWAIAIPLRSITAAPASWNRFLREIALIIICFSY